MARSILVTGAQGFTGRHFVRVANSNGYNIVPLRANLLDPDGVLRELSGKSFDYVVHLAAISYVGHGSASDFYGVNVVGTQNLLEALLHLKGGVEKVLIASSANIYGNVECGEVSEESPPAPVNHYAISKLAMEYVANFYFNRLPIIITRPFNYTGPGQDERFVIPKIVSHFRRRAPVIELGNIDIIREYNDVRFICDSYLKLLECGFRSGVVNICTSKGYTLSDVLKELGRITGHSLEVKVNPDFVRENEIFKLLGNNSKLLELTERLSESSLKETLESML